MLLSPKNKYFFANFNNGGGLSLGDKTKDYADRNTGGQVKSFHEVTQLVEVKGVKKTLTSLTVSGFQF